MLPKEAANEEKSGNCDSFFQAFCGVLSRIVILCPLQTKGNLGILLQRGIAIPDCEAAALPGRFLPELGRSSERPFFWVVSWSQDRSRPLSRHRFLLLLTPQIPRANPSTALDVPAQRPKSLRQNEQA
jgi:hypothetical protein